MRRILLISTVILCACQRSLNIETIVPMCPTETTYKSNSFYARSGSGIDGILFQNHYLKPRNSDILDLEFDIALNPNDSLVVYDKGQHHTIKGIDEHYPGAELRMEGEKLNITYQCELPLFE